MGATPPRLRPEIIAEVIARFSELPNVAAIAIGGSTASATADSRSDVDLYILGDENVPVESRREIALAYDTNPEIDKPWFGPEDGWSDGVSGTTFDLVYWSPTWLIGQIDRVLTYHHGSVGYSTCFWHTVRTWSSRYDPHGLLDDLRRRVDVPYPEELRRGIIDLNWPLLRDSGSSFLGQLELAIDRDDVVSVQHRNTAFLASYFDVLFALNRLPHPGEKHLLAIAQRECRMLPESMAEQIGMLVNGHEVLIQAHALTDGIENLLHQEGLGR